MKLKAVLQRELHNLSKIMISYLRLLAWSLYFFASATTIYALIFIPHAHTGIIELSLILGYLAPGVYFAVIQCLTIAYILNAWRELGSALENVINTMNAQASRQEFKEAWFHLEMELMLAGDTISTALVIAIFFPLILLWRIFSGRYPRGLGMEG